MNLADISIKRPVFITSILTLMLVSGYIFMDRLPVDLFPEVTFPVVAVTVPYPGAGPAEIETLIAKPLENEISTISGIKRLSAIAQEGVGQVWAEFTLETDVKYAEDQIKSAVQRARRNLPKDIEEPTTRRLDPSDQPVIVLAVSANLPEADLFDLANEIVKPKIEQVNKVGMVEVLGGRKREIHVLLDRNKLKSHEISASQVAARIQASGENIPVGKTNDSEKELVYRSMGQFQKIEDIKSVIVNFFGNDVPVTVDEVGTIQDALKDETSRAFLNGKKSLFINVYRQSGANTVAVVDSVLKKIKKINDELKTNPAKPDIHVVRDASTWIRANLLDVSESIGIGILLAIFVVYLFLGNGRSTFITAMALPNSLIGAFILIALAGFSINIMSLLALSLSVGLLVDDAIVVRENIFRHLEMGKSPLRAALDGTGEVRLAVIATTFTVIAVFGPVGFLQGVVGQFFKQFGLTICFAMMISLFDAMTVAPMLSAYLAGISQHGEKRNFIQRILLDPFERFYSRLENFYGRLVAKVIVHPFKTIGLAVAVFAFSIFVNVKWVVKTFLPQQDAGEFAVSIQLPPGTSLDHTAEVASKIDEVIRKNKEVIVSAFTVGSRDGDASVAEAYVKLVPFAQRTMNTGDFKDMVRAQLKEFEFANPKVKDFDAIGGGMRPFTVNIVGTDQKEIEKAGLALLEKLKKYPKLVDVDINFRPGKPEFQVQFDKRMQEQMGVSSAEAGMEMRALVDGVTAAKYRANDREYDIRVRLQEDQRALDDNFNVTYVPNINRTLVPLSRIAKPVETEGPSRINRQDRNRYVQVNGDIAAGAGFADILKEVGQMLTTEEDTKLPPGMTFAFVGQAENFEELGQNMAMAMGLGVLFIYFVLASLYESFITPFTIMLALPLAICGAFFSLAIMHQSLNIFSWIGIIMLLGVSTKNSILLVDYANQLVAQGMDRAEALVKSGKTRLRPILMTTLALIAGSLPIAIGLNEASRQRVSMGIAIIGGLITTTLLTLVVVPAAYTYVDRFRVWSLKWMKKTFGSKDVNKDILNGKMEDVKMLGK